ncbi:MAG: hypothetical protein A2536_09250 [Candidatus Firestonebacteria bacterium RIFOXYD2_FULL_39_29]|nr:MAG: hypothetical protein A2536_09250 [Candidatus Firestonebacteria bacterium RIFOXYD2_FULL_39_29]
MTKINKGSLNGNCHKDKDIESRISLNVNDVAGLVDCAFKVSDKRVATLKLLKEAILKNNSDDVLKYAKIICGLNV